MSYVDMVCLSETLRYWAVYETGIDDARRTQLILASADYEQIALFLGPLWKAMEAGCPPV
jgi:hypothetical protein